MDAMIPLVAQDRFNSLWKIHYKGSTLVKRLVVAYIDTVSSLQRGSWTSKKLGSLKRFTSGWGAVLLILSLVHFIIFAEDVVLST